jgi:hypothetical protein
LSNALQMNSLPKTLDKRKRISAKLKAALDSMIWPDEMGHTCDYVEAARKQNITTRSMRKSLELVHVRMYLRSEAEVFRATLNAKTLSRLAELGWQNTNMNAAVNAVKAIRGEEDESRSPTMVSPRLTIVIRPADPSPAVTTIEHKPVEELGTDPHDPTRRLREPFFRDPTDPNR